MKILLIALLAQMPDLTGVTIRTEYLAGSVYMLEASGDVAGNIGVSVGQDGILIVDDQFAPLTDQISAALSKIGSGDLRFILNTHYHDDHSDGNENLGETAAIVAHANTRKRLLHKTKGHWPDITFTKEASVHFNGEEIKAIYYPNGHTDGDIVIFFTQSNVVHLGDLWNSGISSFPLADIEAGGTVVGILENIEALIPLIPDDARIIPGHGPVSDLAELRTYREMLEETIGIVRRKKDSGMSLEKIQDEGFPPKYDEWGKGYMSAEGWIENIYRSLPQ
jgi:glyoxylase-like metal-dependent hydrolase (beta-lactamase superfamily II)